MECGRGRHRSVSVEVSSLLLFLLANNFALPNNNRQRRDDTEPSSPRNVEVAVVNATALNVTWIPPGTPNGVLKGYRVKYIRTDGVPVISGPDVVGNKTVSHVIVNLQEYTSYSVAVQAVVFGPDPFMDISGNYSQPVISRTYAEVPSGSPLDVQAVPQSSTSIALSWDQPELDDRNGRITGYRIRYYPMGNDSDANSVMVNVSSTEFAGLEKYTYYCFKVAARSHFSPRDGRDVYGPDSKADCKQTNEDVSDDVPLDKVQWQPPTVLNGMMTYHIQYRVENSQSMRNSSDFTNTSGVVVKHFVLFPSFSKSWCKRTQWLKTLGMSSPGQCVRTEEDKPGAPRNVTARQVSSYSIDVTWLVPARENGLISHYTVFYWNDNITDSAELNETVLYDKTSVTITRLEPFTVYAVQVTATTGAGEGNRSLTVREQTDESTPGHPTSPSVTDITATAAVVHWLPPTKPNGIIISYSLTIKTSQSASRPQEISVILPAGQHRYSATQLNEYSNYSAQIRAETSKGFGDALEFDPFQTQAGYDCGKICSIGKTTESQTAANPGELPWQATLCSPLQGHFCSGAVVSCSCILTAAHCVVQDATVPINNITVCVGQHCSSCSKTDARGHSRCFKPISITPHHNFIPFTLNDIAVIKLRNPILCSRNSAMPVSLPNKTQDRSDSDTGPPISSFVTGWERVNSSGSPSDCLRETEVRLITSYRGCEPNHLTYRINGSPINNAVCAGDNGGPLVFKKMDGEGHYVLAGIVSWMKGCGTARETGVYTSVFTHLDWVEQMCKNT